MDATGPWVGLWRTYQSIRSPQYLKVRAGLGLGARRFVGDGGEQRVNPYEGFGQFCLRRGGQGCQVVQPNQGDTVATCRADAARVIGIC